MESLTKFYCPLCGGIEFLVHEIFGHYDSHLGVVFARFCVKCDYHMSERILNEKK